LSESASFDGLRVAGFESRRSAEMTRLLETAGAEAHVSPSMREVPLEQRGPVLDFAGRVIAGEFDVVVFMTGVGFRLLTRALEEGIGRERFIEALGRLTTVARGPKPVAALREVGLEANVKVAEPNTWRDILAACRQGMPRVQGARVAVQEHGAPSTELHAGLTALGAQVTSVPVYEWALPEDLGPLEANVSRIVDGQIDVALFTSSRQVVHMLHVAGQMGLESKLLRALEAVAVGSIGPTTSETLRECGIHVDFEPKHPKLGHLVAEAAAALPPIVHAIRREAVKERGKRRS
jgi:uroporphyrinogen decarboxylase